MTTITFDEKLPLKKTHFKTFREFSESLPLKLKESLFADGEINSFEDLDFRELPDDEITSEMRAKVDESRKKDVSEFIRI